MSVLGRILASKRAEIAALDPTPPRATRATLDVVGALRRPPAAPLRLLAEVKLRSPSAGPLSRALTPGARAVAYGRAGAAVVSVLCDAPFFDGGFDHLEEARVALDAAGLSVPVLAKEFVLDPRQLAHARSRGADTVLLIARIVDRGALADLVEAALGLGLEPVVEVGDELELEAALTTRARVVGVNARDLDTLVMDPARAERVLAAVPEGLVALHLSGVKTPADVQAIAARGGRRVDGALVGQALMREDDPRTLLGSLVGAAHH